MDVIVICSLFLLVGCLILRREHRKKLEMEEKKKNMLGELKDIKFPPFNKK